MQAGAGRLACTLVAAGYRLLAARAGWVDGCPIALLMAQRRGWAHTLRRWMGWMGGSDDGQVHARTRRPAAHTQACRHAAHTHPHLPYWLLLPIKRVLHNFTDFDLVAKAHAGQEHSTYPGGA